MSATTSRPLALGSVDSCRWRSCVAGLVLAGLAVLTACSNEPSLAPGVVAEIEGRQVFYSDFTEYVRRTAGDSIDLQNAALAALFESFLEEELLFALAVDRDLVTDGADPAIAGTLLLSAEAGFVLEPGEIERYYQANRSEFELTESVSLDQILVQDRDAADDASRRLKGGEPWESVADGMERDHGAIVGPSQLAREDLPERIVEPVFSLESGGTTEVLEAEYGYLIFRVRDRHPGGVKSLEEVHVAIRRQLEREHADRALGELVALARQQFDLKVASKSLPFERAEPPAQ